MQPTKSPNIWQGRIDSTTESKAFRWHQNQIDSPNHHALSLLGFACDSGVIRNKGRAGAKNAPDLIKQAMANLPSNSPLQKQIYDAGNIICENDDLEQAQQQLAEQTCQLIANSGRLINLGGGHEIAWGSFSGLANYIQQNDDVSTSPNLGIINFDAHFDLREFNQGPSSGSPFAQVAEYCQQHHWDFNYCCLGVSETSNTTALFEYADSLNTHYRYDHDMTLSKQQESEKQLTEFINKVDIIYLTIDLDVFPAATAPGVSAPASRGVSLEVIEPLIALIVASGKLKLADIAECNPLYDIDNRTVKLAARIAYLLSK